MPIVYGEDDRLDVFAHPQTDLAQLAKSSIVALVPSPTVTLAVNGEVEIQAEPFADAYQSLPKTSLPPMLLRSKTALAPPCVDERPDPQKSEQPEHARRPGCWAARSSRSWAADRKSTDLPASTA